MSTGEAYVSPGSWKQAFPPAAGITAEDMVRSGAIPNAAWTSAVPTRIVAWLAPLETEPENVDVPTAFPAASKIFTCFPPTEVLAARPHLKFHEMRVRLCRGPGEDLPDHHEVKARIRGLARRGKPHDDE